MSEPAGARAASCAGAPRYCESRAIREAVGGVLRPGGLALTDRALEICGFAAGARLLDIGCGLGASAAHLVTRGFAVAGVEPNPELLGEAHRRCPQADLRAGDAEAIPFPDSSFDGIFMECVLSLVAATDAALSEAARVLRPGGRLVISDVWAHEAGGEDGELAGLAASLAAHGLVLLCWEDHSSEIAQLVARLVFAGIPAASLTALPACSASSGKRTRPGYFLAVAQARTGQCPEEEGR